MNRKWDLIEVENEIIVPFQWMDHEYGRAEFAICPKFKYGKLSEFWVYPLQQRRMECWHVSNCAKEFSISSYGDLEPARVWILVWCREHKTNTLRIYTPDNAKFIMINHNGITFLRELPPRAAPEF